MPTYLVTYHHGPGLPSDPAVLQQMLAAFQTWVAGVGPAMIDPGAPLGAAKVEGSVHACALARARQANR